MFALKIAASYAPELHLDGVVAQAPPSQFNALYRSSLAGKNWPLVLMTVGGFHAAYGKAADPSQVLTPTGIKLLPTLAKGCRDSIFASALKAGGSKKVFKSTTLPPAWQKLDNLNDPVKFKTASGAPLLIVHGTADTIVPASFSATLAKQLCGLHQDLERWTYPGLEHSDILWGPSGNDVTGDVAQWITDRFAGASNPDPYMPTGNGHYTVGTTTCT
jgi:pimeloyl-ACP methyl ester carboxylesterase